MINNVLIGSLILSIILIIAGYIHYKIWRYTLIKKLNAGSRILQLSCGPVEYAMLGKGPTIFISHGGGTGYDNIYLYDYLVKAGFRLICPSKPGYLRTSLSVGETFEAQADMFAELLDKLEIKEPVCIIGVSLGGPAALQFALRHPDRVRCLVMQDAVSKEYHANEESKKSILGKMYLSPIGREAIGYLMDISTQLWPESIFKTYLQVETTYPAKELNATTKKIMSIPGEKQKIKDFSKVVSPLGMRCQGMDMEMRLSEKLSRYPLENITVPTLVTQSRVDKDVTRDHGEFVAQTVKNAELYEFDGCGHMFWFGEEGEKVKNKLIEFLLKNLKL
ncbi:MAG: alpha/beta hydrolase [Candidatus Margulisiibacteriota bacterium]